MPSLSDSSEKSVDFRRLPVNVSLATCIFELRVSENFLFCGIAEIEDDECFQRCNQCNLRVQILILETTFLALGQKKNYMWILVKQAIPYKSY